MDSKQPLLLTLTSLGKRAGVGRAVATRLVIHGDIEPDFRLDFNGRTQPVFLETAVETVRRKTALLNGPILINSGR